MKNLPNIYFWTLLWFYVNIWGKLARNIPLIRGWWVSKFSRVLKTTISSMANY